jgi:hypothetical protein
MQVMTMLGLLIVLILVTVYGIILLIMPIPCDEPALEKINKRWPLIRTLIGRWLLRGAIGFALEKKFDSFSIRVTGVICFSGGLFFTTACISGLMNL